jgi:hypothetical protein
MPGIMRDSLQAKRHPPRRNEKLPNQTPTLFGDDVKLISRLIFK